VLTDRGNLFRATGEVMDGVEVLVVDNDTGSPIENASVTGTMHSEARSLDLRTNVRGVAALELRLTEPHTFELMASAVGYGPRQVYGTVTQTANRQIRIELTYDPFDLVLDSSGSLARAYAPYTYTGTRAEPFTAQREVELPGQSKTVGETPSEGVRCALLSLINGRSSSGWGGACRQSITGPRSRTRSGG